jgi:predicted Zn-dependent protease with MMP-like domain
MQKPDEYDNDDALIKLAETALGQSDPITALEYCETILTRSPENVEALFLAGEACREIGSFEDGITCYQQVVSLNPSCSEAWSALSALHFDYLQFGQARREALRAIRIDPHNPEAHYVRGLLRERGGDERGARRDFHRAHLLSPENFPKPVLLSDTDIEQLIDEAISDLDRATRAFLGQVAVLVEDFPDEEVCLGFNPPAPPGEILGYFSGVPVTERSLAVPWTNLPSALVLYRKNLERIAWDRQRVIEELRLTVFYEIGHFLGIAPDEAALGEE